MQNLDEKIDSFLYESLLKEYVKASDFRATYSKIAQIQGAQEKQMYGLDKELAKEFVGLIRLLVVCEEHGAPPYTIYLKHQDFLPDLILALPKPDETKEKVKQFLGWDEDASEYARSPGSLARLEAIQKFVHGEAPLDVSGEKIDIDFKKLIIDRWEDREESFKNRILGLMKIVTRYIHKKMPDPEGRPLSKGSGNPGGSGDAGVRILPSKLSDGKTNYLYVRVVNFLNKNQTEVDKKVQETLDDYNAFLERTRENYRNQNKQKTPGNADREYGYTGPGPNDGATRESWIKFVVFLRELDAIGVAAQRDYGSTRPDMLPENLIKEDKLNKIVINFAELRKKELNESFLAMFGGWVEHILNSMFGGGVLSAEIQGSRREVESFAKTIAGEKHYIEAARRYGSRPSNNV